MKRFLTLIAVVGLMLVSCAADAALAGRRVALVIGNSAYQNVARLPNPARDAKAVAELFEKAGFDVVRMIEDVGNLDFKRAIRAFEDIATGADVAVVFYAGHGIEIGGVNYLIPVNAKLASDRDAQDEAIPLDRLVQSADPAKQLRLVILDACRDNPFARRMKRQRYVLTRAITAGLGAVEPTSTNTLIAYAAKAGSTADDGAGKHSPFTRALLKHLAVPGLDIRLAFGRVRDDVLKQTGNRQEPFVYGSLGGANISLVALPSAPKQASLADARRDYKLVERIGTRKAWEVYLSTHNKGLYAALAREQLAKLSADQQVQSSASVAPPAARARLAALAPTPAPVPAPPSEEARAWDRVKDSSNPAALRAFIQRYPDSVLALTAQTRLKALEQAVRDAEKAKREVATEDKAAQTAVRAGPDRTNTGCERERRRLHALKSAGDKGWVRADLKRLQRNLTCDALRPEVVAALGNLTEPVQQTPAKQQEQRKRQEPPKPAAAARELVLAAQQELGRIGCFDGAEDGVMGPVTTRAIDRYFSERGRPATDTDVTEGLVKDLTKETSRVCPLVCAAGQVAKGERCIAVKRAKPTVAHQRDRREDRRSGKKATREDRRQQASRPKPRTRQEAVRRQPASHGGGSAMIGVGF